MGVKSNLSVAGNASASFSKSATALNSISVATSSASRTNVSGNGKAQPSTKTYGTGLKNLANGVISAGNNIHSVAKDFTQIDQQASTEFQKNLSSPMAKWGL